jgi:hypothetical protein
MVADAYMTPRSCTSGRSLARDPRLVRGWFFDVINDESFLRGF